MHVAPRIPADWPATAAHCRLLRNCRTQHWRARVLLLTKLIQPIPHGGPEPLQDHTASQSAQLTPSVLWYPIILRDPFKQRLRVTCKAVGLSSQDAAFLSGSRVGRMHGGGTHRWCPGQAFASFPQCNLCALCFAFHPFSCRASRR